MSENSSSVLDALARIASALTAKAKEIGGNENFRAAYEKGTDKAKAYGRMAKLGLEINGENEELKKVFTEIGHLYYEQAKDAPDGFYIPLFEQVSEISDRLSAKQDELAAIRDSLTAAGAAGSVREDTEDPSSGD